MFANITSLYNINEYVPTLLTVFLLEIAFESFNQS